MRAFTIEEVRRAVLNPAPEWALTPCVAAHLPCVLREAGMKGEDIF